MVLLFAEKGTASVWGHQIFDLKVSHPTKYQGMNKDGICIYTDTDTDEN
jgi:hypothetical protein